MHATEMFVSAIIFLSSSYWSDWRTSTIVLSKSCEPTEIDQLNSRRYQEMPLKRPRDYWMSFVKLKPGAKSPIAES